MRAECTLIGVNRWSQLFTPKTHLYHYKWGLWALNFSELLGYAFLGKIYVANLTQCSRRELAHKDTWMYFHGECNTGGRA